MKRIYGYGIVDKQGEPWWDEACVAHEPGCLRDVCKNLNDPMFRPKTGPGPYRVAKLFWISRRRKRG